MSTRLLYNFENNVLHEVEKRKKPDTTSEALFDRLPSKWVEAAYVKDGRTEKATMILIDSKSIKNAGSAGEKGYDAGKKLPGSSGTWG
jgi:hypothetical protein